MAPVRIKIRIVASVGLWYHALGVKERERDGVTYNEKSLWKTDGRRAKRLDGKKDGQDAGCRRYIWVRDAAT